MFWKGFTLRVWGIEVLSLALLNEPLSATPAEPNPQPYPHPPSQAPSSWYYELRKGVLRDP